MWQVVKIDWLEFRSRGMSEHSSRRAGLWTRGTFAVCLWMMGATVARRFRTNTDGSSCPSGNLVLARPDTSSDAGFFASLVPGNCMLEARLSSDIPSMACLAHPSACAPHRRAPCRDTWLVLTPVGGGGLRRAAHPPPRLASLQRLQLAARREFRTARFEHVFSARRS